MWNKRTSLDVENSIRKDRPYISLDHSTYKDTNTKARFIDDLYGEWFATPTSILKGRGHPQRKREGLSALKNTPISSIIMELEKVHGDLVKIDPSTYTNKKTVARFIDSVHGEWWTKPTIVLKGARHPNGRGERIRAAKQFSKNEIQSRLDQTFSGNVSLVSEEVRNVKSKLEFTHKEYGNWTATLEKVLEGRCSISPKTGDRIVDEFIEVFTKWGFKKDLDFIINDKKALSGIEIDFYFPNLKVGIEYHGLYWHNEKALSKRGIKSPRNYHKNKADEASKAGISLIQIWEHEWLERKEQVLNFIKPKLGLSTKIGARKCNFKEISKKDAMEFCEKNHIQGGDKRSMLQIGAYYNDELVCVTTFAYHHRNNREIVLSRMCSKDGITVVGALSKMSRLALDKIGIPIYTWVHKTLSNGNSYIKSGWEVDSNVIPDYFYYNTRTKEVCSKQSRKKSRVKTPSNMTEAEHAELDNLVRIWDCGKIKLRYNGSIDGRR
jgi:hypothetical protein